MPEIRDGGPAFPREIELQLRGLKALADERNRFLKEIELTVRDITGDLDDETGWVSDFVYGENCTVENLWQRTAAHRLSDKEQSHAE